MKTNKLIVPLAVVAITAGTLFMTPAAYAETNGAAGGNFFSGLAEFISQKVGVDKAKVESAVKEYHQQHMKDRAQKRLDALVQQGKITADQEKAILAELASLHSKYSPESMENLTPEERRTKMQEMHNELKTWAQSQNIDPNLIMPPFGKKGFGMGHGGRGHWNGEPSPAPTQ